MSVNFDILNQKGSPAIYSDVFANRPTASYAGRLFISTDTKEIYRDTGSAWEEIAGQGSGNIQGSGTANYVPKFTDTETIGNSQIRDDGTGVGIGVAPSAVYKLDISGSQRNTLTAAGGLSIIQSGVLEASYGVYNSSSGAAFLFEKFDDATATFTDSGIYALGGFYTKVSDGSSNFYNSFFSNGNVGIGVVSDNGTKLNVSGTFAVTGIATFDVAVNIGGNITLSGATSQIFGGTESGRFFINNSTQSTYIALYGNTFVGTPNIISFINNSANTLTLNANNTATFSSSVTATNLYSTGASNLATTSGNVGIGTSSPDIKLTINAGSSDALSIRNADTNYENMVMRITGGVGFISMTKSGTGSYLPLVFYTSDTERMRITSGGNLLIGTTTDSGYKLDVNGTVNFSGALTGTSATFSTGINITGNGGFFNAANKFGLDQNLGAVRFYSNGGDASTKGSYEFHINSSNGSLDVIALGIASTGAATFSSTLGINGVSDNVKSGTYTPTLDGATNVTSSSASICQYLQVGNTVTVSGRITITATSASTLTAIRLSLPLTSGAFTSTDQCGGTGYFQNGSAYATSKFSVAAISLYTVNMIYYSGASTPISEFYFSFTYQII